MEFQLFSYCLIFELIPINSAETESDSGFADSNQFPGFKGFGIDSNLFFKDLSKDSLRNC